MMKGFIYITTNTLTGVQYIGKKYYFYKNEKESNWKDYLGSSELLKSDIKLYGRDQFSRIIIAEANDEEALSKLEKYFIDKYDAVASNAFYNRSNGSDKWFTTSSGVLRGLETRKKWSDDKKRQVSEKLKNRFVEMSPDVLKARNEKISLAHKNNSKFKSMRSKVQKKVMSNLSEDKKKELNKKQSDSVSLFYKNWTPEQRQRHIDIRANAIDKMKAARMKKNKEYRENTLITLKHIDSNTIYIVTIANALPIIGCSRGILNELIRGNYNSQGKNKNIWKQWTVEPQI